MCVARSKFMTMSNPRDLRRKPNTFSGSHIPYAPLRLLQGMAVLTGVNFILHLPLKNLGKRPHNCCCFSLSFFTIKCRNAKLSQVSVIVNILIIYELQAVPWRHVKCTVKWPGRVTGRLLQAVPMHS